MCKIVESNKSTCTVSTCNIHGFQKQNLFLFLYVFSIGHDADMTGNITTALVFPDISDET